MRETEQKAEAYRQKSGAFVELANNSLWLVFDKVVIRGIKCKSTETSWCSGNREKCSLI